MSQKRAVAVSEAQSREILARYVRASLFVVFSFAGLGLVLTLLR